ncbi:hypothetical protein J3454_10825 [Erythrobacter sp. NFXS35]|uniref:curli-like amyloid fiber formation chaperone CsgH n=1 Tax=Erythrobacter sp. NFXS35 TaxID=2818436 RepID=UPI0032DF9FC9
MIWSALLPSLLLPLASSTVVAMTDRPESLTLDIREHGGALEVQLIGDSSRTQSVSYVLEVSGQSTSRHRGKTTLTADARTVLSTIRANAGDKWCVRLLAEEEGLPPYEILQGNCTAEE